MQQATPRKLTAKQRHRRRYNTRKKEKKAKTLTVKLVEIGPGARSVYRVIGEHERTVTLEIATPPDCTCSNGSSPCSHVIAVFMYRGESWQING